MGGKAIITSTNMTPWGCRVPPRFSIKKSFEHTRNWYSTGTRGMDRVQPKSTSEKKPLHYPLSSLHPTLPECRRERTLDKLFRARIHIINKTLQRARVFRHLAQLHRTAPHHYRRRLPS